MNKSQVTAFLRCPSGNLVDFAVALANLTWREQVAITLCGKQAKTQEIAAEEANVSVDSMQHWYSSGMRKLQTAWSGVWWIEKLAELAD